MLKRENIEISITNRNKSYFQNLKYEINGNKLIIKTTDLPKSSHQVIDAVCDLCHKEYRLRYDKYVQNESRYGFFSCKKCSTKKKKITNLEKFGVDNYAKIDGYGDIVKEINKERYGNANYNNIDKHKQTMLEKYGVEYYMNLDKFREKSKATKKLKYGDEFYTNFEKIKQTKLERYGDQFYTNSGKTISTNVTKYGVDNFTKTEEFKEKIWKYYNKKLFEKKLNIISIDRTVGTIKIECHKGHVYDIPLQLLYDRLNRKTEPCLVCNPLNSYQSSGYESQLKDFIKENYQDEIIFNNRNIIGKEIDVYLPKIKIALEFNGLYWHNELNVSKEYHLTKTELAEKNGIKLIQIYEDDWVYKQKIVKSRILNFLNQSTKIYARKCEIKVINDNNLVREFLNANHLQGYINSNIEIGLFFNDNLVSLMTFGSLRKTMGQKTIEGNYEMLRFCNALNTLVIGGASKLFNHFLKKYNPKEIISYADRSWSSGNIYEKLGFILQHKTNPNYSYVIRNKRYYRYNYRKDKLVKEGFSPSKTEHEIMFERKIYRIYDSGHLKYKFSNK